MGNIERYYHEAESSLTLQEYVAKLEAEVERLTALNVERREVQKRNDERAVDAIIDWLRGDEAEAIRAKAIREIIPPEDELAAAIEHRFGRQ